MVLSFFQDQSGNLARHAGVLKKGTGTILFGTLLAWAGILAARRRVV